MGSLYRSEEMCRCQLFLQTEAAYACVAELGELGLVQFRDLNPDTSAFQRKFVSEVRRCEEMERKLRYLEKEIKKDAIPILDTGENPDAPQPREMVDLEATFEKLENELREVNTNEEMLKKNFLELTELKHILKKTQVFFDEGFGGPMDEDVRGIRSIAASAVAAAEATEETAMSVTGAARAMPHLGFVAGVILRERIPAFERLLWRACRGNVFLRQAEITEPMEDPVTADHVYKSVFIIFFQGDQLKTRVKKICEGFRATLYPCPETPQERREMAIGVMTRIEDLKTVLGQTQDHRHRVLVAAAKNVRIWFTKVRKIKAVYHTLNLFNLDVTQKCLIAECWCPVADLDKIQLALKRGTEESGSTVPSILNRMESDEDPPTYHRTNKFTAGFQNIVDAYGIASYREVNPAPYTIITFPFLFAVMFGDVGHGFLMLLFALFLVVKEKQLTAKKIQDEIFNTFFGGRYIILLMGAFSIYTGLVYNEVFSKSFNLFGSAWRVPYSDEILQRTEKLQLDPANNKTFLGSPYPFGMDPIWNLAGNKLNFFNSFKMKMSVIFGISQMLFGVVLSYQNHRYFQQPLDIFCTFIPQLLFLICIFFYLCIMILYKWTTFGANEIKHMAVDELGYPGSHCAPSLLIGLINMFMFKPRPEGFHEYDETTGHMTDKVPPTCYLNAYYRGQVGIENFFVFIAMMCVPVMLAAKPVTLYMRQRKMLLSGGSVATIERILVLVALLCVPWMLLVKPLYLRWRNARGRWSVRADMNNDDAEVIHHDGKRGGARAGPGGPSGGHGHGHGGEFNFGEMFINQAIHTIEFCLGCISHTASYLRLWALSLAHAQLSEVLWAMVMRMAFKTEGAAGAAIVYLIFWGFGVLTVGVLVVMEGLSAFLHALRLHWVEFQSKFYGGNGYSFVPFSFDAILEQARAGEGLPD